MILITSPTYFAQNIQTGNANAESSVQTNIQGGGSVSTHIEVSANGEKKVLNSNSPGTYTLNVSSSNNNTGSQTITPIISSSPIASPSPKVEQKNIIHKKSLLSNIENVIQNLINIFLYTKIK